MTLLRNTMSGIMDLAWPNLCLLCGKPLINGEHRVCLDCLYELPKTAFNSFRENLAADRFYGKILFEKATTGFRYQKESKIQMALELIKYKGEKELGEDLASYIASRLLSKAFFNDLDCIVPVPLHKDKAKKRGYNQSEWIAKGLSKISGIPYDASILQRHFKNPTQTTKNIWERWENTEGIFELKNLDSFAKKHILLVDDVLTSGSTLCACGLAVQKAPACNVSFFALALA